MPVCFLPETKLCFGCVRWIKSRNLFSYVELNSHEVAFRSDPAIIRLTDWKTLCFSSCSFQNQSLTWLIISLPVCLECKVVLDSMHAPGFNSRISSFDQNLDWDRKISKSNLQERKKERRRDLPLFWGNSTSWIFPSTTLLKENILSSEFSKICTI